MALPLDDTKTLIFVAWLLNRGLQARTISTYLAGIRQTHLAKGLIIPTLRPDVVKQVLTGAGNLDRLRAKPLTLKNFFSQNVCVAAKPLKRLERKGADGIEMIYDFAWEDPASMAEVTESLVNYMTALHQLWPYDPTAIIMLRLINKYNGSTCQTTLEKKCPSSQPTLTLLCKTTLGAL